MAQAPRHPAQSTPVGHGERLRRLETGVALPPPPASSGGSGFVFTDDFGVDQPSEPKVILAGATYIVSPPYLLATLHPAGTTKDANSPLVTSYDFATGVLAVPDPVSWASNAAGLTVGTVANSFQVPLRLGASSMIGMRLVLGNAAHHLALTATDLIRCSLECHHSARIYHRLETVVTGDEVNNNQVPELAAAFPINSEGLGSFGGSGADFTFWMKVWNMTTRTLIDFSVADIVFEVGVEQNGLGV